MSRYSLQVNLRCRVDSRQHRKFTFIKTICGVHWRSLKWSFSPLINAKPKLFGPHLDISEDCESFSKKLELLN